MSLREYVRKRDFSRTREPGKKGKPSKRDATRFVIQKHGASRLHYDFRLEMDGVLKSWAVPKGVPLARSEKRLAMHVEDHPLDYADFEGTIPRGQYGGGTVMVWDAGSYKPLSRHPLKDLKAGKLHFILNGDKLSGEWALVRIKDPGDRQWLLMKIGENHKPISKKRDNESSKSGRTMAQIARDGDAVWNSKETQGKEKKKPKKAGPPLEFIEPMKAKIVGTPPSSGKWTYELKFDGYRAIALKNGSDVQLLSRNEKDLGKRFPDIKEAVASLPVKSAILDGEIVAVDDEGRSSFQLLQALETGTARPPVLYYLFDLLSEDGKNLCEQLLKTRRERLQKILEGIAEPVRFSTDIHGDPERLLTEVGKRGLEGIIGKKSDSHYEPGRRSGAWIKLKCVNEQEFVIGGFTPPGGTRKHFGALLVGYYEKGKLQFSGKVGTGFDHALLAMLHKRFVRLKRDECPFDGLSVTKLEGANLTHAEWKRCNWIKPALVCEIRFSEWTHDGKLRQPVFLGLREDKAPRKVVSERAGK